MPVAKHQLKNWIRKKTIIKEKGIMETSQNLVTIRDTAKAEWKACYEASGLTIRKFAKKHAMAPGTLLRFIRDPDYEPKDPDLRVKLGLPVLVEVTGQLCACGCGQAFAPKSSRHRYIDRRHRWRHRYQLEKEGG